MIILGIDPGLAECGWGLVYSDKFNITGGGYGTISTKKSWSIQDRINELVDYLVNYVPIISQSKDPHVIAMEAFTRHAEPGKTNFWSTYKAGLVAGAVYAGFRHIKIHEYETRQIKRLVAGSSRATKANVQQAVKRLLGLQEIPRPQHAADALAAAICHYLRHGKGF